MHQFLVLLQDDLGAHLLAALVADDGAFWVVHGAHVVLQLALGEESMGE